MKRRRLARFLWSRRRSQGGNKAAPPLLPEPYPMALARMMFSFPTGEGEEKEERKMEFHTGKIMVLTAGVILFTAILGCMNMNLAGESREREGDQKVEGTAVWTDGDLELRASF